MPRKLLILIHMYLAAFFAPLLILVALSGGLYLIGVKGATSESSVPLPPNSALNYDSPNLEADVRSLLADMDPDFDFEYISQRGSNIETRPTSRTFYEISQASDGTLSATLAKPNIQHIMMELHMGHGPKLFKLYQKFAAFGLFLIVLGGLWVGLASPVYRRKTLATAAGGTVIFTILAFIV